MERRVLCQELGTAAGGFGGSGKGRSKYPDCSPVACSSTSEPRQVMRVWPTTREFQGISSLFNNPLLPPLFSPLCSIRQVLDRGFPMLLCAVGSDSTLVYQRMTDGLVTPDPPVGPFQDAGRRQHRKRRHQNWAPVGRWGQSREEHSRDTGTDSDAQSVDVWGPHQYEVMWKTFARMSHVPFMTSQIAGDSREFFFLIPFCSDFFYMLYFMWLYFFLQIKYTDV